MIFELEGGQVSFPHPKYAEADGLLAVGGDLTPRRLLTAYKHGIFPWYADDSPILWYAPHNRFVLHPNQLKVSKSMKKVLSMGLFNFTYNTVFEEVITNCSNIDRKDQDGTWIIADMRKAYTELHHLGFVHSIEVWKDEELVGGLYGVLVGGVFCGESMFAKVSNASKAALVFLIQNFGLELIDCQVYTSHLESMGAIYMPQQQYLDILQQQHMKPNGLQIIF
ncbi:leucyl/phenylalanyl-tRNA--protein transferase [Sphingobacterium alkalisoli]|uniref:Leucyl/phenylalanyl-tRNA--protein transferase n=1 Tax=Sphingobacterium alkalisoli TaxID=1874115 RepID=A0A4U0HA32_9SPHI|nr:leucyl/phenylalanyl-tRNA--protein transferase [Sphingobacterium alkalisoli]TJY68731.1 leucyl/phenylalanyl-tRNA--protein transferase [Sphingobacterium alkalisoli]GGH04497.1 leucyl/phenylalanyl-tRNA--protein transferase [Sphingobacterium alkalisoli]